MVDLGKYMPRDAGEAAQVVFEHLTPHERVFVHDHGKLAFQFFGPTIRGAWRLWKVSELKEWFVAQGIESPEHMSEFVMTLVNRKVGGKDFDLVEEVRKYKEGRGLLIQ